MKPRSKRAGWKREGAARGVSQAVPQFAVRYVEQHKKDFKRLGIFGRWSDPY